MIAAGLVLLLAPVTPEQFFDRRVAPILTKRCLPCHNRELDNAGVSFQDRATVLKGGSRGPGIVPGDPDQSVMIQALKHEGSLQMPPGPPLPAKEIKILREWVQGGAVWGKPLR